VLVAKVKVENGPVTIELEADDPADELLAHALSVYRKVAALPPAERQKPLPGTTDAQVELAGYQPLGFAGDVT
jgi:hypothetical protein